MKRFTLLLVGMAFTTLAFAKNVPTNNLYPVHIKDLIAGAHHADNHQYAQHAAPNQAISPALARATTVIPLGSSFNPFSTLLPTQNELRYMPALNSVAFGHRQNADAPAGGSGVISYDYSIDGGSTWDASNKQITPALGEGTFVSNGNRYPSSTIWNPAGNTNPANAYFVSIGAALHNDPLNGNGWGWHFVASSPLVFDGTGISEKYYTNADSTVYIPFSLTNNTADNSLWYTDLKRNADLTEAAQGWDPVTAYKLEWDAGTSSFVRSVGVDITPDFTGVASADVFVVSPMIEFSPDGQTGYIVYRGSDAGNPRLVDKPIIYKSTDAGATWTKQPFVDYSTLDTLISLTIPSDGQAGPALPYFCNNYDITVDADGELHIFASMLSGFSSDPDSTGFIYAGRGNREMFHFQTDGVNWEENHVRWWNIDDGNVGDGSTDAAVEDQTQISRTEDGSIILMSWSETDTLTAGITTNDAPDVWGFAYRDLDGFVAGPKNLTAGTDGEQVAYWPAMSPVSITGGDDYDYEMPIVFATPSDVANALAQIDYYYLKGVGFNLNEFYDRSFVATNELDQFAQSVRLFPTPATTTMTVDLGEAFDQNINVAIIDMNGRLIERINTNNQQVTLDVSGYSNGMYFVNITSDKGQISKKFTVLR